jgi:hypothetical protein
MFPNPLLFKEDWTLGSTLSYNCANKKDGRKQNNPKKRTKDVDAPFPEEVEFLTGS